MRCTMKITIKNNKLSDRIWDLMWNSIDHGSWFMIRFSILDIHRHTGDVVVHLRSQLWEDLR